MNRDLSFEDEDDYEYEIWLEVFSRILRQKASFYHFSPEKLALLSLVNWGYALCRSQNDKPSNIW